MNLRLYLLFNVRLMNLFPPLFQLLLIKLIILTHGSLCRPTENHILTAEDAFEFCKDNILGIQYIFLDSEGHVQPKRLFMKSHREPLGDTIPGTQSFHHFEPVNIGMIAYKKTSEESNFHGCRNFFARKSLNVVPDVQSVVLQHFVACEFDDKWWLGMVQSVDNDEQTCEIKFMHHKGQIPHSGFYWPRRQDICWVNFQSVLLKIPSPALSSNTARSYSISILDQVTIQGIFDNRNNTIR